MKSRKATQSEHKSLINITYMCNEGRELHCTQTKSSNSKSKLNFLFSKQCNIKRKLFLYIMALRNKFTTDILSKEHNILSYSFWDVKKYSHILKNTEEWWIVMHNLSEFYITCKTGIHTCTGTSVNKSEEL